MVTVEKEKRNKRKSREGVVVSKSGSKSIVVRVETRKLHPRYKKVVKTSKKFHAHDEEDKAVVGDIVQISESRPTSKMKKWRLVKVLEHKEA